MKKRELERILIKHGWQIAPDANHDIATNKFVHGVKLTIPRHTEINEYTARGILKCAGIDWRNQK